MEPSPPSNYGVVDVQMRQLTLLVVHEEESEMALGRTLAKAGTLLYAGYKWLEDHTDEVDRWSARVIDKAAGKSYEKVVVPPARLARSAAEWVSSTAKK